MATFVLLKRYENWQQIQSIQGFGKSGFFSQWDVFSKLLSLGQKLNKFFKKTEFFTVIKTELRQD